MSALRVVAIVVLVAGVAVLVWQLTQTQGPTHEGPASTGESTSADSRPESRSVIAPIVATPFRATADEADAGEAATSKPSQPPGRSLRVIVVPGNVPAAGALVEFTPLTEDASTPRGPSTEVTADDEGRAELPKFKGTARVRGTLGASCGTTILSSGIFGGQLLKLVPALSVRVLDAGGAPQVGVPVAVVSTAPWRPVLDRAVTGEGGIARLSPKGIEVLRSAEPTKSVVALGVPLDESVEAPFDPAKLPEKPIELVLPPTGRVVVKLVTSTGQPFTGPAMVQLDRTERTEPMVNWETPDTARAAAIDGVATFAFVGLKPGLEVSANPADRALRTAKGSLEGPRASEATATLVCGGLATLLTGRLVTPDRKPISRMQCDFLLPAPSSASRGPDPNRAFTMTDVDGKFRARFDLDPATVTPTEVKLDVKKHGPGLQAAGAYVDNAQTIKVALPEAVRTGAVDLGDIIVPDLDFVASGVVVNEKGPVAGAAVFVLHRALSGWERRWGENRIDTTTGIDGRFELRGKSGRADLGITAHRDGSFCGEPVPFEIGARDVRIVMSEAGGLRGSIKGLGPRESLVWTNAPIAVSIVRKGSNPPPWTGAYASDEGPDSGRQTVNLDQGKFEAKSLRPGTYTVEFYPNRYTREPIEPLLAVDDVVITPGVVNRDPRLQDIELAKLLKTRTVTVVDESSRPLADARVAARIAKDDDDFATFATGADGRAVVATPDATVEIVVTKKGYRATTLPQVSSDATAILKKTSPKRVTIRLPDGVEIPPPPFYLAARLQWVSEAGAAPDAKASWGDPRSHDLESPRFGPEKSVTVLVDNPGVYEVEIMLWEMVARGSSGSGIGEDESRITVTVPDEGAVSITAELDAAELKRRLEAKKE